MVKSEEYHSDEFCSGRKSSCDEDNGGVSQWSTTNGQSLQRRRSVEKKIKSNVCDLLLVHSNSIESGACSGRGNESALSSSSSTCNESSGMLMSPAGNQESCNGTGASNAPIDDKRLRRQIANCNERRRMQSINTGFQALRQLLPYKEGEKMSKAAILQQTADFIHTLQEEKDRLSEENELIAQAKKRRIENSHYNDDKMDIGEEFKVFKTNGNGKPITGGETSLDVLECLKTIQELRRELVKEQHLRMVYERELKNKSSTSKVYGIEGASSFSSNNIASSTNGLSSTVHMDTSGPYKDSNISETYQQMLLNSQNQSNQPNNSSHSMVSAFSAISSLQGALNVGSPLIPVSQTAVINSNQNLLADSSKSQPQVVIQTALNPTDSLQHEISGTAKLPSAIIVNDSGIVNSVGAPATITFALANDTTSLGTTSNYSSLHQPAHIVLDVGTVAGSRFITLNHSNPQHNSLIINTSHSAPTISEFATGTTPVILSASGCQNISQFPHQLGSYSNNSNMLVQVEQKNNFLNYNSSSILSPKVLTQQNKDTVSSIPSIVSSNLSSNIISSSSVDNQQYNLSSVTTANSNSVNNNSASLSQRNLQAILDAIRHIEGGTISTAAAAAISANSSSPSCTQASDLLVR